MENIDSIDMSSFGRGAATTVVQNHNQIQSHNSNNNSSSSASSVSIHGGGTGGTGGGGAISNNSRTQPDDYLPISQFYTDRSVFITGGTGFMGKVLVEKLLRSCPGIKNLYLLIRPKRGQETTARLNDLLNAPVSTGIYWLPGGTGYL